MASAEQKSTSSPDASREFPAGRLDEVTIRGASVAVATLEPGWTWAGSLKEIMGTQSCMVPHFGYVLSGRQVVRMDDGTELELKTGDLAAIPPGHDAWIVGEEPFRFLDFGGAVAAELIR